VPPDDRGSREDCGEPDVARVWPEAGLREREQRAEREETHPDEEPGLVAAPPECFDCDGFLPVLGRDHEHRGEVQEDPGAAGEREGGECDPVDERVDVEVAAEAGGDAADPAALMDPDEPTGRRIVDGGGGRGGVDGVGHVSLLR
jgi:hypothetical protein